MDNVPAARGYSGGFGTDLMLKDLGLATDAAKHAKQPVALGAVAQQLYQIWSARAPAAQDFSSIINLLKQSSLRPNRSQTHDRMHASTATSLSSR